MIALLITSLLFIGLAVFLAWFLIAHDRGAKEPIGVLWIAFGFGVLAAVAAGIAEVVSIPAHYLNGTGTGVGLLVANLGVGLIEESCKFWPLAFYLYRKPYFNERTDGTIYFALAGLGFGVPENILYTLGMGASTGFGRLILTPFFHAATTSIVGYYCVRNKLRGRPIYVNILPLLCLAVVHGLYDFGLTSHNGLLALTSLLITASLTILLFVYYRRAGREDKEAGLTVIGTNTYCRACGAHNPDHYLYCVRCGQRA